MLHYEECIVSVLAHSIHWVKSLFTRQFWELRSTPWILPWAPPWDEGGGDLQGQVPIMWSALAPSRHGCSYLSPGGPQSEGASPSSPDSTPRREVRGEGTRAGSGPVLGLESRRSGCRLPGLHVVLFRPCWPSHGWPSTEDSCAVFVLHHFTDIHVPQAVSPP